MPASKEPDQPGNQAGPSAPGGGDGSAGAGRPAILRRRRQRLAPDGTSGLSRPLVAALIVIIAGGAYLFWPRGGSVPRGIGEQISVITALPADSVPAGKPRSGSVDIEREHQPLVAEEPTTPPRPTPVESAAPTRPAAAAPATPPATEPAPATREPDPIPPPVPQEPSPPPRTAEPAPRPAPSRPAAPEEPLIQPQPTGRWAVQIGAFGTKANAEAEVQKLQALGIEAQMRAASTSSGDMIFRVWIGWFPNRSQALAYAEQQKRRIGEAHPVHR